MQVTITVGPGYIRELRKRMRRYEITQYRLAKQMDISETQVSRWFVKEMMPSMRNVERIERAIMQLRRQQERTARKKTK